MQCLLRGGVSIAPSGYSWLEYYENCVYTFALSHNFLGHIKPALSSSEEIVFNAGAAHKWCMLSSSREFDFEPRSITDLGINIQSYRIQ